MSNFTRRQRRDAVLWNVKVYGGIILGITLTIWACIKFDFIHKATWLGAHTIRLFSPDFGIGCGRQWVTGFDEQPCMPGEAPSDLSMGYSFKYGFVSFFTGFIILCAVIAAVIAVIWILRGQDDDPSAASSKVATSESPSSP